MEELDKYSEVFFWSFTRKNNVNYNFEVVQALFFASKNQKDKKLFYKPIYILLMSIIECTLYDFLRRIREHRSENIVKLNKSDVKIIKDKKLENKLMKMVNICEKHQLLGMDSQIYFDLKTLADLRNRVHIQNEKLKDPQDEKKLWTLKLVGTAGELFKYLYRYIGVNYPRPERFHSSPNFDVFPAPWKK
jgi:preprotein translocase subunit SecA